MQVEHELPERATEPGELALDHREARPGQLDAGGEIHVAEPFADIEMLFRLESVSLPRTMLALLAIEALVQPLRLLLRRTVRHARHRAGPRPPPPPLPPPP